MNTKNEITASDETSLPASYMDSNATLAVSLARAEIDQQVATARALPRSIERAIKNIVTLATLDEETAAECIYALPRGGKTIRGPSIRFAEIVASQWGNARVGSRVVHVDRLEGYVEAEGVFHDLETNVAQTARVRRQIQAKRGKGIDNDMIQLAGAAASSIARRNAILAGVPKGVARKGYLAVEEVLRGDIKTLSERRGLALKAFATMGVTSDRVYAALGVQGEGDVTLDHLLTLTGTRSAIKNGEMTVEEAFPVKMSPGEKPRNLVDALDKLSAKSDHYVNPETGEITEHAGDSQQNNSEGTSSELAAGASTSVENGASDASSPLTSEAPGPTVQSDAKPDAETVKATVEPPQGKAPTKAEPTPARPVADPPMIAAGKLEKKGEEHAAKGIVELRKWYVGLTPDQQALLTPAINTRLKVLADKNDAEITR